MTKDVSIEKNTFQPVGDLIIRETAPVSNEGAGITFTGYLPTDTHKPIGYVEGYIEHDDYADISDMVVYPQWREKNFGAQLFRHFIREGLKANVETMSLSAANERTAHLMGTIPGVKEFTFTGDRAEPLDFTIEEAVKFLEEARIRQGLTEGDEKTERLKAMVRITAHMR